VSRHVIVTGILFVGVINFDLIKFIITI